MPAKNHLNSKQIEKLQKALKEEKKGNIREKILILLLLKDGKTQSKIAEFLGCSVNKVSYTNFIRKLGRNLVLLGRLYIKI
jgi:DNA-directed RNA polymerase specialized sigma subunit